MHFLLKCWSKLVHEHFVSYRSQYGKFPFENAHRIMYWVVTQIKERSLQTSSKDTFWPTLGRKCHRERQLYWSVVTDDIWQIDQRTNFPNTDCMMTSSRCIAHFLHISRRFQQEQNWACLNKKLIDNLSLSNCFLCVIWQQKEMENRIKFVCHTDCNLEFEI